jgi:hypothetical protein
MAMGTGYSEGPASTAIAHPAQQGIVNRQSKLKTG